MKIYPIKLKAVLKDIIWGGTQLSDNFGLSEKGTRIAEAWTLTLRGDGENTIENGEAAGFSLSQYAEKVGMEALCGSAYADKKAYDFPLLVKLIDAKDNLSVQVHPDDAYAHSHGIDSGKTEMWYIVDAEPGAKLVYGLVPGTDMKSDEFTKALDEGNVSKYLNYVEVKKGDVYYIPAGLVHAIGAGILIAEVQQNSNSTFRIYDYGRVGADGKPRELHIDAAKEVVKTDFSGDASFGKECNNVIIGTPNNVVDSQFFGVDVLEFSENGGNKAYTGYDKMMHVMCVEGAGKIMCDNEVIEFKAAESVLIPAALTDFEIVSNSASKFILGYTSE